MTKAELINYIEELRDVANTVRANPDSLCDLVDGLNGLVDMVDVQVVKLECVS